MPQQEQAKDTQHKPVQQPQVAPIQEQAEFAPPFPVDMAAAAGSTGVDGSARNLGRRGVQSAQRQAMASQLAQRGGNVYLKQVMARLARPSGVVVQRGLEDALDLREDEAAWDLYEDYQESQEEKGEFKAGIYQEENYFPSTGRGQFNVLYSGSDGKLYINVKVKFTFIDGSSMMPNGARVSLRWTDEQKQQWKDDYFLQIYSAWGAANISFYCQKDWWEDVTASAVVLFSEVEDGQHFNVNVTKIPQGEAAGSSVRPPEEHWYGNEPGTATLDSEDLAERRRRGGGGETNVQIPAVHESGHMLGLADEYVDSDLPEQVPHSELVRREFGHTVGRANDDRLMSQGGRITAENGVTFLEGLRVATAMQEWGVAPKPPRAVPPNPEPGPGDYPAPGGETRVA